MRPIARPPALLPAIGMLAVFVAIVLVVLSPSRAGAAQPLLMPAPAGSQWTIIAGYNSYTHTQATGNPYAVDLARTDGQTDGTHVLAPVDGAVTFVDSSCIGIRDAARTAILLCHLFAPQSLRNTTVTRGQDLGVVAPPGQANNNGVAHIHMALTAADGKTPLPFVGVYAIEGTELPATDASNAYAGTAFTSTNPESAPRPTVMAGTAQTVRPGRSVTLSSTITNPNGGALFYHWSQIGGPAVTLLGATTPIATFVAPTSTTTLQFRFVITDASGSAASDTTTVRVGNTPVPVSAGVRLVGGNIPSDGGFGLIVFAGGTNDDLVSASGCPRASAAFWSLSNGNFVSYVPASTVAAVNQAWTSLFNSTIPPGTPLLGKCR